ncbi:ComEA family DNA-binding protein [Flagellimonas baculiformis]|uniref:ComEA family DNA-binding protein n=1 Tax=Flagellimonas baculiformis TaxID=3067310 RepID=UPI00296FF984|nr:ComEA family DNA-binding protein [Muricauda sp. D6]
MRLSHFKFNKQERSGIFFLLLLVALLQGVYFFVKSKPFGGSPKFNEDVLALAQLDSLRNVVLSDSLRLLPFNPNYISDYKGYVLGLSTDELDRLFAFRKQGKYVNSAADFQEVTQISDSLLETISPYFKFPEWRQRETVKPPQMEKVVAPKDLNLATKEELMQVNGIGEKLSDRIINFRERLGGFLVNEQLYDVYGLEPEVVKRALASFQVLDPPTVTKVNINTASAEELSALLYINRDLAREIVSYREGNGAFSTLDELRNVKTFPKERIDRIKLYLTL